jgi:hypothetical protein
MSQFEITLRSCYTTWALAAASDCAAEFIRAVKCMLPFSPFTGARRTALRVKLRDEALI